MSYDGDADKIRPDLPKLLNECAGGRSDSEAGLMGLAAAEIERLRDGIQKVLDEGAPRTVAEPYADDGKPHKGDRCPHECFTWESFDACTDEYLALLLAPDKKG